MIRIDKEVMIKKNVVQYSCDFCGMMFNSEFECNDHEANKHAVSSEAFVSGHKYVELLDEMCFELFAKHVNDHNAKWAGPGWYCIFEYNDCDGMRNSIENMKERLTQLENEREHVNAEIDFVLQNVCE
jgi:hypothetical protein